MLKYSLILFFSILYSIGNSQPFFQRYDSIPVEINGNMLSLPWGGGLNFIQTSNIDLNLDGIKDLFVFDRTGNKIKTFINKGIPGTTDYAYLPEYEAKFPNVHDWVVLKDYNCDGKEDIFTFSNNGAGFSVYKNTSSFAAGLQFTLVAPLVFTDFTPPNGGKYILYVSSASVPGLADIDNDGDLDVVTYGIGGSTIEYHINKSKELYGTCDSLIFEVRNNCWGYSYEDPLTFQYTLNDTCIGNVPNPEMLPDDELKERTKHSNSCQLCIDLNGDNVKDFVVSNISFGNIVALTNGGTPTAAHFTQVDYDFPANNGGSVPVSLTVFPCAFYTDINTDGKEDLVASPSATNVSENFNSVVYYENVGTSNYPAFQYRQSDLLQKEMIEVGEGAYPSLFDYDNDGLKDLFIGNYGYYGTPNFIHQIAQFKNTGTATVPKFKLISRDYANLSSLGIINMVPTFGDLDGDTDSDMIIGGHDGKLHYFENTAPIGANANFVLTQTNLKNSNNRTIDVGDFATPQIVDVDGDSKNDLVIGGRNGKLAYYKKINTSGMPQLDSVTHLWGNVNVTLPNFVTGYSFPCVYKNGTATELIVGSQAGYLNRYNSIDGNLNGVFNQVDSAFLNLYEGTRTAPAITDINNDDYLDLFIGNYAGGLGFYKGSTSLSSINDYPSIHWNLELFPNPVNHELTIQMNNPQTQMFQVDLCTVLGQLILTKKINTKVITINTDQLSQGIYICKVSEISPNPQISLNTIVKKIVVQH